MKKIVEFANKYGILILIFLGICILLSTCGTKGGILKESRRIDKLDQTIHALDSTLKQKVSNEKLEILLEINALEIAREVVYTNNAIVRTTTRPDDAINSYNNKIKILQEKLKNIK